MTTEKITQDFSQGSHASENQLFVQTLSLPVSSLIGAKKSVKIMLSRLSPIPAEDIVWDLAGPLERIGDQYSYRLGMLRAENLDQFRIDEHPAAHILSPTGEVFEFIDGHGFRRIGKTTAKWLLLSIACYGAAFWALAQWGAQFDKMTASLNDKSAEATRHLSSSQTNIGIAEAELALINSFESQSDTRRYTKQLAQLSLSLGDKDWISSIEVSPQSIQLSGYGAKPAEVVRKISAAFPGANIRLGSINADRVSGLNRFSVTVSLLTETKTLETSQ